MYIESEASGKLKLSVINGFAWDRVRQYQKLNISRFEVSTPFYSNDVAPLFAQMMKNSGILSSQIGQVLELFYTHQVPFGWFQGKGTPEQIAFATEEIARQWELDLSKAAGPDVIVEFMKAVGLGIDCSGFVYQTLNYAFEKARYTGLLNDVLAWSASSRKKNECEANVKSFAGSASRIITPEEVRPIWG